MALSSDLHSAIDVLCVVSNCPQILDPRTRFHPTPVRVPVWAEGA